jgi:hypothetical protein
MATVIRKAVPADAQAVADIFNGFVTRHSTLGVKPSWTAASVLQNITGEHQLVLIMEVDGKVSAFFLLWIENSVARVQATGWTAALETVRPDPQFTFGNWMADHQADIGATQIEAVWYKNNPFSGLIARAATANLFAYADVGKATEITTDDMGVVHMISLLNNFGAWFKSKKAAFWTALYKV